MWRRLRAALDGFPTTMMRFVREVYGPDVLDEAWTEFVLWEDADPGFDPDSVHLPVFMPWFFHRWTPDPADTRVADASLHGRSPTSVLLERRGTKLDPLLRRYLQACVTSPFSFYEVVHSRPGHGFRARDIFTGEEHDVLERSASRTFGRGNIFFGQVATCDGVTLLEACPGVVIPPGEKLGVIDLRDLIEDGPIPLTRETLSEWGIELREEYLACVDAIMNPAAPRLQNTDGEPLEFHRLHFEIPSAREAFDALGHLALPGPDTGEDARAELLESAEFDDDGRLRRVSFTWQAAGNPVHDHWDNTILGHLEIRDGRLVADVNSAGRAARLREIVESACRGARHTGTDVETVDDALARTRESGSPPEVASAPDPADDPEVRARLREITARHYEAWIHEPIPALGGRSPIEAVQDRSGREKVEALITSIERDGRNMDPPLDQAVIRQMRERLGLVG
ncbi:MAG: hypothetical protein ACN0LA_14120 [Candidatus Longimicrobiales bacterium M2_2A_002]